MELWNDSWTKELSSWSMWDMRNFVNNFFKCLTRRVILGFSTSMKLKPLMVHSPLFEWSIDKSLIKAKNVLTIVKLTA